MAQYQYRSQVQRYEDIGWLKWIQQGGRKAVSTIAAIAFIAGLIAIGVGCVDETSRHACFGLAALLLLEALAFWLLARRVERIRAGIREWFARFFGNRVAVMMRKTQRAAPFEAVYDLRGDLLTYARIEKGHWTQRWHRNLDKFRSRGVVLQAPGLLAIFRKPGTVVPVMIVLITEDGGMAAAIRALGWTIVDIDPTSGDPAAPEAGAHPPAGGGG